MTDSLILTFAELEFMLALRPRHGTALRGNLRLESDDDLGAPSLARAGLASLLARGLCETVRTVDGPARPALPDLRFDAAVSVLLNVLAADDCATTMAAAWGAERGSVMHVVDGGGARMALFPERLGRYSAEVLDPAEPLPALLRRFLDLHLADGTPSALVATSVRAGTSRSVALAVDPSGQWSASDSVESPDHAVPVARERALERIDVLFDDGSRTVQSDPR